MQLNCGRRINVVDTCYFLRPEMPYISDRVGPGRPLAVPTAFLEFGGEI